MFLWRESIEKIIELRAKGNTIRGIARELGISKNTAKRYIRLFESSQSITEFWESLLKPSKKLSRNQKSSHLNSYQEVENRTKTEKKMAGKRAENTFKKYHEM